MPECDELYSSHSGKTRVGVWTFPRRDASATRHLGITGEIAQFSGNVGWSSLVRKRFVTLSTEVWLKHERFGRLGY